MEATTALKKIINAMQKHPDAHTICLPGGQGSGKTTAALIILINHALNHPNFDCYVAGKELSKLKVTTMKTFVNIMKEFGLFDENQFKSNVDYIFSNGSHIRFLSLDRPGAYKGNRSDCCFIDEANECSWEAFRELTDRSKKVIASWNPNFRSFCEDILMKLPDTVTVRTTFKDNEYCPENEVKALLQYRDAAYDEKGNIVNQEFHRLWQIYGLGVPCKAVGAIYTNWEIGEFDEKCKTIIYGADFGSNDPSTLVKVGIDKEKKILYLKELIYEKGCGSFDLVKLYKQVLPKQHLVIGDSAAPMTITDLRQSGINIKPCVKGKILDEIQVLQSYHFIVDPNSKHILYELDNCRYADSETRTTLVPGNDHCFTSDTIITTIEGDKQIKDVKVGDCCLTSEGYKRVEKFFNNGVKEIGEYEVTFDNGEKALLKATHDHKIKTINKQNEIIWKELKSLKKGDVLFKCSEVKNSIAKTEAIGKQLGTKQQEDCTELFGNTSMEKFQKDVTFITKTGTKTIIKSKILNALMRIRTCHNTIKKDLQIQKLEKRFWKTGRKLMKQLRSGIKQTQNHTKFIQELVNLDGKMHNIICTDVKLVDVHTQQEQNIHNIAQTIVKTLDQANLKNENVQNVEKNSSRENIQLEINAMTVKDLKCLRRYNATVYDLQISEVHEFFANGILVHNCLDAMRYAFMSVYRAPSKESFIITV